MSPEQLTSSLRTTFAGRRDVRADGIEALQRLVEVAHDHSGQCGRITRFLASCYNGFRFPFDLSELRGLDQALFDDCLAVLKLDFLNERELHRYFENGSALFEGLFARWELADEQMKRARMLIQDDGLEN